MVNSSTQTEHFELTNNSSSDELISPIFIKNLNDLRPYVPISCEDITLTALLDTGAMKSVLGKNSHIMFSEFHHNLANTDQTSVLTADGNSQRVLGHLTLPITCNQITKDVEFLIVPTIQHRVILGIDFCRMFNLNVDFPENTYEVNIMQTFSEPSCTELSHINCQNPSSVSANNTSLNEIIVKEKFSDISVVKENDLSNEQREKLNQVIKQFSTLVSDKLGCTDLITHKIEVTCSDPFRKRPFLLSPYMQKHVNSEINKMLELGVIRPSRSPYCSNILLVPKASGEMRLCFDGRALNSVTIKDRYPLPNLNQILSKVRDAHFLSSIDLKHAFWQIKLEENSCEKTAFAVVGRGHFEFVRMPFGLCNSAQTLQRLMDRLFDPAIEKNIFIYLDDLVLVNSTFEEHLETLTKVYITLKSAGLTINLEKCKFCRPSLSFLGYVVDKNGLHSNPERVSAVVNYSRPSNVTEIKRFIGMVGWYQRFIKGYSDLIVPLNELIKGRAKRQSIKWTEAAEISFQKLKQCLITTPVLTNPDFSKQFIIQTDASNVAVAAVLIQGEGEEERVISYASKTLTKCERNWTVTEREAYAIIFAINKFRCYIEGSHFKIITDHFSLLWLNRLQGHTGRLARWSIFLSQFDYEIHHRSGKNLIVADALSRSIEISSLCENIDKWYQKMLQKVQADPEKYPLWAVKDNTLFKHIETNHNINTNIKRWKLVVPKSKISEILYENHDSPLSCHLGFKKTLNRIMEQYFWPGMRSDIKKYLRKCRVCNEQKVSQLGKVGLMGAPKQIDIPFQLISVDIMGPFPKSKLNNQYLLVVVDWFTKYTFLHRMKRATTKEICNFMENSVFLQFGVPMTIVCDNGSQFISKEFKALLSSYNVKNIWYNAKYHPQINFCERANRVIKTAIRSYIKDDKHNLWDSHIPKIASAICTSVHDVTGYSPSFLTFGRIVPLSGDYYGKLDSKVSSPYKFEDRSKFITELNKLPEIYENVSKAIQASYKRNQKYYNLRKRNIEYEEGDFVYKKNYILSDASRQFSAKLAPAFVRCKVNKKISRLIYELVDEQGKNIGRYHIKSLKSAPVEDSDGS